MREINGTTNYGTHIRQTLHPSRHVRKLESSNICVGNKSTIDAVITSLSDRQAPLNFIPKPEASCGHTTGVAVCTFRSGAGFSFNKNKFEKQATGGKQTEFSHTRDGKPHVKVDLIPVHLWL
jgi:hypothetical protein